MVPMRCIAVVGVVLAMMSVSAAAQTARWATADDPVAKEMIAKERMWANGNGSPQPELKDVIADELQGTATDGRRYGKAQAIQTDLKDLDR